jgi:ketol-acid reductoisomerase
LFHGIRLLIRSISEILSSLKSEYCSDIFGERGILLGTVHGIVESLYRRYQCQGMTPEQAFIKSSESITGKIVKIISTKGIKAVYDGLSPDDQKIFQTAYSASYTPAKEILQEIYDEVSSGKEIRTVIMHGQRLDKYPVCKIGRSAKRSAKPVTRTRSPSTPLPLVSTLPP